VDENNSSRNVQIQWIRVLRMKKGELNFEKSEHYYSPDKVPEDDYFYVPVSCQQCENTPCIKVYPVKATWKEPDGVVVIDYNWCIGCRFCMAAYPYRARKFNWKEPEIPVDVIKTNVHYLGNRPRMKGVVEKCTFCVQRTREGRYPACVEICPVGARKFGNLLDPESEIRYVLKNFRTFRLKEELNTEPKFFYFFSLGWG
jgi:molybdopterin-containing oxidoreductase family iron-sulfur binding subunit